MTDQATMLRGLIERRTTVAAEAGAAESQTHSIAVTSGKGGVGKSNIALSLAIAVAELGKKVCLIDANSGLGNIDLLCRLNGYWNLSHVMTGARTVSEICLAGPAGITVIPGADCLSEADACPETARGEVLQQLEHVEAAHDLLVVDAGTGLQRGKHSFISSPDTTVVVTTPEPTSIADAYALLKTLGTVQRQQLKILVNQARTPEQAGAVAERIVVTSRMFLRAEIEALEPIPLDFHVTDAVARRAPFLIHDPDSPATRAIRRLARRLAHSHPSPAARGSFFQRAWRRDIRSAA